MLIVQGVEKTYIKGGMFSRQKQVVLQNISFDVHPGECLGIIGESGSGKSTLGRLLLGIENPDRGSIRFEGMEIGQRKARRGRISAVFQDYTSSLHPFYTVEQALLEPLRLSKHPREELSAKVDLLLRQVGLDPSYRKKYPHELSGGEAQRVCIARAVSTEPRCIVLDEAISSLDGSVQFQVLELLKGLRETYAMSYVFITHDLQAAAYICDRIMIIREGQVTDIIPVAELKNAQSGYARQLLSAMIP
ncbi:ABC transporter ATP-binding protein [Paenibacillus sp. CN-4]|uniref:ABC transporter ATP-binding protein n=1 Tax=Paenibacillus nanchangensis TaxID=3348343 RepID=UPI00397CE6F2